jgi:hypothetical protein
VEKLISAPGSVGILNMNTSSASTSCPAGNTAQCSSGFS